MAKRILILGASGFIGKYLYSHLCKSNRIVTGTFFSHENCFFQKLNLHDLDAIKTFLTKYNPNFVIFLSGTKDVPLCEKDPIWALNSNVQIVKNYLLGCSSVGLKPETLYFSTDYVFDGVRGHYANNAIASPRTIYGATNMIAERMFQQSDLPTLILRVSAVMGKNGGFYHWLENNLLNDRAVELFDNTYFSPTSIGRLCDYVDNVSRHGINNKFSVCHLSDGYRMTRFEFGLKLASKLQKPQTLVKSVNANTEGNGFQFDLSLLPDGFDRFIDYQFYDEFARIY